MIHNVLSLSLWGSASLNPDDGRSKRLAVPQSAILGGL
jgi:hypothetical protein